MGDKCYYVILIIIMPFYVILYNNFTNLSTNRCLDEAKVAREHSIRPAISDMPRPRMLWLHRVFHALVAH